MTKPHSLFQHASTFAAHLRHLRNDRRQRKLKVRSQGLKRQSLSASQRQAVLAKTAGRCHICGGTIDGTWQADHVFAHAQGGQHRENNYLPSHNLCNNYRWFYGMEEFQWVLKLGVYLRTKIETEDALALQLAEKFVRHEVHRESRRSRH